MCAEQIVASSAGGSRVPTEADLKLYIKKWDKLYGPTYKVLEILQNIFYSNDAAREAFVEMCDDKDVQRLTFDSYLYKRVVMMNPWQQLKLTFLTLGAVLRGQALAPSGYKPVPSAVRSEAEVEAMEAVGAAIKGGIRSPQAARDAAQAAESAATMAVSHGTQEEEREPVLAGK
jgi:geranylgeranyl reductase